MYINTIYIRIKNYNTHIVCYKAINFYCNFLYLNWSRN